MAKKKKGNIKNIQPGATVQFLNYLTPDHILRGKYNTGNNELDITDVPANLNSVITLGQGGGGGLDIKPLMEITLVNNMSSAIDKFYLVYGTIINNTMYVEESVTLSPLPSGESRKFIIIAAYHTALNYYSSGFVAPDYETTPYSGPVISDEVNCSYNSEDYVFYITDPTQNASVTLTFSDE